MHRTTIMLPEDLKARAQARAEERGISLGDLVRECLADGLDAPEAERRRSDPLFRPAVWTGDSPRDLAEDHDRYLYAEGVEG